jgi:hypothetical protein
MVSWNLSGNPALLAKLAGSGPSPKGDATMSGPEQELTAEQQAKIAAVSLGRTVLGRDLSAEESDAMTSILEATVQALRHGFIRRLAEHVRAEREDESVEEFFENVIEPK